MYQFSRHNACSVTTSRSSVHNPGMYSYNYQVLLATDSSQLNLSTGIGLTWNEKPHPKSHFGELLSEKSLHSNLSLVLFERHSEEPSLFQSSSKHQSSSLSMLCYANASQYTFSIYECNFPHIIRDIFPERNPQ
jgi:hypothetical protein